jgi:hypothetical protein
LVIFLLISFPFLKPTPIPPLQMLMEMITVPHRIHTRHRRPNRRSLTHRRSLQHAKLQRAKLQLLPTRKALPMTIQTTGLAKNLVILNQPKRQRVAVKPAEGRACWTRTSVVGDSMPSHVHSLVVVATLDSTRNLF